MPNSAKNIEAKPYNVCIDCTHIGLDCDGPNFLAMSAERWCEWCKLRKEYLDLTNADIAESAGISEVSVARVMSGHVKDIRMTTMQAVTKALVNGSWGQYPCAMAAGEQVVIDNPVIVEQCKQLQAALDRLTEEHKAEIDEIQEFEHNRVEYLKEQVKFTEEQLIVKDKLLSERYELIKQRNRAVFGLSLALGLSLAAIISALIADLLNPNIGFFWVDNLLSLI